MAIATVYRRVMGRYGIGIIFVAVGLVLLLVLGSIAVGLASAAIQRTGWPTAQGVVTGSAFTQTGSSSSASRSSTTIYPKVSFVVDGKRYDFTSKIGGGALEKGSKVTVQYKAGDPSHAEIKGRGDWVPILLGSMGLGFLIIFGLPGLIAVKVHLFNLSDSPPTGLWATRIWPTLRRRVGIPALVCFAIAVAALVPLGILSVVTYTADSKRADWPSVQGTVVQMLESKSYDDPDDRGRPNARYTLVYAPIVQYTVNGRKYSVISHSSSATPSIRVGDTMTVHYEPGKPANGVLDAGHSFVPYLLGGLGLGFALIFGLVGFRLMPRR